MTVMTDDDDDSDDDDDDTDDDDDDSDDIDIDWVWGCGDLMRPSLTALSHTLTFWPGDENDE